MTKINFYDKNLKYRLVCSSNPFVIRLKFLVPLSIHYVVKNDCFSMN